MSVFKIESLKKILDHIENGIPLAIPTETVYGLAASIDNPLAIRQIFALKERPVNHPLIIHASSLEMAQQYAHFTKLALNIGQQFWPGPLTLILPKKDTVLSEITGGLDTVGIRIPQHPITLAIIEAHGTPLAAPSANKFGRTSPTTSEHVLQDYDHTLSVVEGGPCSVGVESTILDLSVDPPAIRRLGSIGKDDLLPWITEFGESHTPTSGTHKAHYAPSTALLLSTEIETDRNKFASQGLKVASIDFSSSLDYAQQLYAELRRLDQMGFDILIAAIPATDTLGTAVLDRLQRASVGSGATK